MKDSKPTYMVRWRRDPDPDNDGVLQCRGLTAERLVSRLIGVLRNGRLDGFEVVIEEVVRERAGGENGQPGATKRP